MLIDFFLTLTSCNMALHKRLCKRFFQIPAPHSKRPKAVTLEQVAAAAGASTSTAPRGGSVVSARRRKQPSCWRPRVEVSNRVTSHARSAADVQVSLGYCRQTHYRLLIRSSRY
jgi:hypothetical protein